MNKGTISSNLTAQRILKDICHTKENPVAFCQRCNCTESKKCEK